MQKLRRKSVSESVLYLTITGRMDVLLLLRDVEGRIAFEEICRRTNNVFPDKSNILSCLREELILGLIEKQVENNLPFYKITPKGREVVKKLEELAEILNN